MCNCNSSFCNICCRRVKAYRFDDVPEITGDLQLYTEFYKVGEAYGHWKFTIDDLEAYLDIPKVLWSDKLVAFGHTATGGLFYQSDFIFDYTTSSLTVGAGSNIGIYSAMIGDSNSNSGGYSLLVGQGNNLGRDWSFVGGQGNTSNGFINFLFGTSNITNGDNSYLIGSFLDDGGFLGNLMLSDSNGGSLAIANDSFTAQFAGGYRFRLDASSTAVSIAATTGIVTIDNVVNNNTEDQLLVWNVSTKEVEYRTVASLPGGGGGSGTVTSVDAAFLNGTALTVVGGAITTAGTFDFEWQGLNTDYVAGDGSIIAFPTLTSGTVTAVNSGAGMDFTNFTTSGTIILGTPSTITLSSTNAASGTTHSHEFDLGGTAGQYLAGDNTLQTFPTIPTVTPSVLTKTDDTNVTLTLGGTPSTALLQATSITVGWSGTLAVSRGGSGAGTFTAGYLKANGTSAFTTVATIPYSDITGTPTIPTQYWQRSSTNLAPLTAGDTIRTNLAGGDGWLHLLVGDATHTGRVEFYNHLAARVGFIGYYEDRLCYFADIGYHSFEQLPVRIQSVATDNALTNIAVFGTGNEIKLRTVASLPFTNNTGTVTSVAAGAGMNFTTFTTTGSVIMGTPSSITLASANSATGTTHSHALALGGTSAQYLRGDNTLATFPTIIDPTGKYVALSDADAAYETSSASATTTFRKNSEIYGAGMTGAPSAGGYGHLKTLGAVAGAYGWQLWKGVYDGDDFYFRSDGGSGYGAWYQVASHTWVLSLGYTTNTGTVTSVAMSLPVNTFSISGSPVTATGTLTGAFISQTQKTVLAAPWGANGTPIWRQLQTSDLQPNGAVLGQVIMFDGTQWDKATLTYPTMSGGTGISVVGSVITNTLPSKWTLTSTTLSPSTITQRVAIGKTTGDVFGLTIYDATNATNDLIRLENNNATAGSGSRISFTFGASTLLGYIQNYSHASLGFQQIVYGREQVVLRTSPDGGTTPTDVLTAQANGYVKLHSVATATDTQLLTIDVNGVVRTRTIASLTGLTTDVWKIQGGTTNASAITDDIYHNGKLRVGNSTSSAYMLSVAGTGYFTSTVDFNNNVGIQGFTTGAVIKNLLKLNASNYAELGTSGNDLLLAAYTSGRSADTKATTDKFLYVNTSGLTKLDKSEWIRNDGASVFITSTESHAADSTPRRVTFDGGMWTNNTFYGQDTTSGDYKINFPSTDSEHLVICTLEYTTAGTPTVTLTLRETSTTVETNITTSADGRKVLTIQTTMSAGTSDYPTLYISVATSAITLQKCRLSIIPLGETPP